MLQLVAKMKSMALQLKNVGEMMTDATVMGKILSSLPPRYDHFQTLDNVDEQRQTIQNLTERLVRKETRHGLSSETAEVLAAVKSDGAKKKTRETTI